jgi:hypothetical protein
MNQSAEKRLLLADVLRIDSRVPDSFQPAKALEAAHVRIRPVKRYLSPPCDVTGLVFQFASLAFCFVIVPGADNQCTPPEGIVLHPRCVI